MTERDLARKRAIFERFPVVDAGTDTLQRLKDWMLELDSFYTEVVFNTQSMAGAFMSEWHARFPAGLDPQFQELQQKIADLEKATASPGTGNTPGRTLLLSESKGLNGIGNFKGDFSKFKLMITDARIDRSILPSACPYNV